jgi:4-coumarate--CoA ligase (photoactive yellow protein activation family)
VLEIYGAGETAGIGWRQSPDPAFRLFPYWRRCGDGIESETRAVAVPDRLDWLDDRRFTVVGRLDGGVKVGGTIVHPERVRACLLEHPAVRDAAVRPAKFGDIWRIKAFIVPTADHDPATLAEEMHRFVETSLTAPERPRSFTFGPTLPHDAQGKPADWG